jgi:uncharacterized protein
MKFEWDEEKRLINLQRHGIDFADAIQVFDFETLTEIDDRFDYGETRFITLGLLFGKVVVIVHTETENTIRIISVRNGEKYDEEKYFKEIRD